MFRTPLVAASLLASLLSVSAAQAQTQTKYYSRATVAPKTAAPTGATCGLPQQTYWYSGGTQNNLPYKTSAAAAQVACNVFTAANPTVKGVCLWNPSNGSTNGSTYVIANATMVKNSGPYALELYAAVCQ